MQLNKLLVLLLLSIFVVFTSANISADNSTSAITSDSSTTGVANVTTAAAAATTTTAVTSTTSSIASTTGAAAVTTASAATTAAIPTSTTTGTSDCLAANYTASISSTDPGFEAVTGTSSFVTCTPSADNVVFDGSTVHLGISNSGCPTSCGSRPHSCAQYAALEQTFYGAYTCSIKATNVAGTEAACIFSNGASGTDLQQIYVAFRSNDTTNVYFGFLAYGAVNENKVAVNFATDYDYHTYRIAFADGSIRLYIDGASGTTSNFNVQSGGYRMPDTPGTFQVQFVTAGPTEQPTLGIFNATTAMVSVQSISFNTLPCSSSYFESSEVHSSESATTETPVWKHPCTMTSPLMIFDESFENGWNLTTNASMNQHDTQYKTAHNGVYSLSWSVVSGGLLIASTTKPVIAAHFWALEMWVNGGIGGANEQIAITLTLAGNDVGTLHLSDPRYTYPSIPVGVWVRITIPLNDFNKTVQNLEFYSFDGFYLTSFVSEKNQFFGVIALDNIQLTNGIHCTGDSIAVYSDSTNSSWTTSSSWGDGYDLQSQVKVSSGSYAVQMYFFGSATVAFTTTVAPTSTNDFFAVQFDFFNSLDPAADFTKVSLGVDGPFQALVPISNFYGGQLPLPANGWVTLTIPFIELGFNAGDLITGVSFRVDGTSNSQGAVYYDNVKLVANKPEPSSDSSFAVSSTGINLSVVTFCVLLAALCL